MAAGLQVARVEQRQGTGVERHHMGREPLRPASHHCGHPEGVFVAGRYVLAVGFGREEAVLVLLSELRDANTNCALEWPESGGLRLSAEVHSSALHGRLRVDKGWYLVTGGLHVDQVTEVALSELVRAPALGNGRFVRLPSGDFVELNARIRRVISALKAVDPDKRSGSALRA